MIYVAFLKPGPLGRLLGSTLAENRPKTKKKTNILSFVLALISANRAHISPNRAHRHTRCARPKAGPGGQPGGPGPRMPARSKHFFVYVLFVLDGYKNIHVLIGFGGRPDPTPNPPGPGIAPRGPGTRSPGHPPQFPDRTKIEERQIQIQEHPQTSNRQTQEFFPTDNRRNPADENSTSHTNV